MKRKGRKSAPPPARPVDAIVHRNAKRLNIPTRELRGFVRDEEVTPRGMLYPRDTSLDPQLVWKGKDQQDSQPLSIPVVPIYIQEKISAQALIEDLRASTLRGKPRQTSLFADFNGISFDQLVDFYHHEQSWTNRMILGDSLIALTSLTSKEGLRGKVQMVYLDPPYGIKFASNWQVSTRKRGVQDGKADDVTRQPEQVKAYRDTWELGIHSYLTYLRDRLTVIHDILTPSGSVFLQIGVENAHLVRSLLDEVFGSENFVAWISFVRSGAQTSEIIASTTDSILWYAKDRDQVKARPLYLQTGGWAAHAQDQWVELQDGTRLRTQDDAEIPDGARAFSHNKLESATGSQSSRFPIEFEGKKHVPTRGWSTSPEGVDRLKSAGRLLLLGDSLRFIVYHDDFPLSALTNLWTDTFVSGFANKKLYVVETPTKVIERCILLSTDPGDLVLDPTCGSGTTAYAAEQWGRRWITVDTSRVAIELARARLMTAKFPYYLLADSPEGVSKESEILGHPTGVAKTANDIRKGFVYARVPHITMKSIVNNPDLKPGLSKKAIRDAIVRHADSEILFDDPYEDRRRIRVSGPFTVESLSPHRTLGLSNEDSGGEASESREREEEPDFVSTILENLKRSGIQNTVKGERLNLNRLDLYAGKLISAEGEFEENGKSRRIAIWYVFSSLRDSASVVI